MVEVVFHQGTERIGLVEVEAGVDPLDLGREVSDQGVVEVAAPGRSGLPVEGGEAVERRSGHLAVVVGGDNMDPVHSNLCV